MDSLDRELATLLAERIRRLATLGTTSSAAPDKQSEVPTYVWEQVDTACRAAAHEAARAHTQRTTAPAPRTVVIAGARGVMGQLFRARLEAAGHTVRGLGRGNWDERAAVMQDADLVLVSVPIENTSDIIRELGHDLPPDAVLADLTSMKEPYVDEMLAAHTGAVVGLHPLFGPGIETFLSQKVVVCHGRGCERYQWFLDFIVADGARLIESSPAEHDQMMVAIQAIRHFTTLALGVFLTDEGIDIPRSLEFSSPNYRLELDLVGRLIAQDSPLYADIMLATPARQAAIVRLAETTERLADAVRRGDRAEIIRRFDGARETLGDETTRALHESDRIIQALSIILAADKQ